VGFETFREHADGTPLFKGLPDDRCQSPHWGYVKRGKVTFKFADHDEVYEGGDAYYAPPGHVPVVEADTEVVEFSPTEEYGRTMEVLARNLGAMQAG
jgi:ribosomal protein L16 Arg81 hydroxylase